MTAAATGPPFETERASSASYRTREVREDDDVKWASADMVDAARNGSRESLDALITQIWPSCFRVAASILGDRDMAQDAAQETCLAVSRNIASLRSIAAFDTWLYRIVLREAMRSRKRHRTPCNPIASSEHDHSASLDLWRALDQLPSALRDIVVLTYFDDLTSGEISSIIGIPHVTVRVRLMRARERLRKMLAVDEVSPGSISAEVHHAL
jgi:RNA polymerase sigma-70 factor (ECF subfamily)